MRPPEQPMHMTKRRATNRLCVKGICSVHITASILAPGAFSDKDKASYLDCSSDGMIVSYTGPGSDEKEAASVRTDHPIPIAGVAMYYFEVGIADQGETGRIGIGLCDRSVKLEKMPGWESGSYAYHGDDGMLFRQTGIAGTTYGPKYGSDDIIGCCWDLVDNTVLFTKNGKNLGVAFSNLSGTLYPTVGMQSKGGRIKANFGDSPFVFDIEAYAQQQREKALGIVMARDLPQDYRILSDTVLAYLMHNGYAQTAAAFAKDAGRESIYEEERESMLRRQAVCEKVLQGNIDAAIRDVEKQFPHVLSTQLNMRFLLCTQKFIEMIVSGSSPEEAVQYGQRDIAIFRDKEYIQSQEKEHGPSDSVLPYADILRDVYSLLAYGNPSESPAGHLTRQSRREMVADRLNSAILASQGRPMRSMLERFISQSETVLKHVLSMRNGAAALVSAQDML